MLDELIGTRDHFVLCFPDHHNPPQVREIKADGTMVMISLFGNETVIQVSSDAEVIPVNDGFLFQSIDGTQLLLAVAKEYQVKDCDFFGDTALRAYDAGTLEPTDAAVIQQHIKICRPTAQRILGFRRLEALRAKTALLVSEFHQPEELLLLLGAVMEAIKDEATFLQVLRLVSRRGNAVVKDPWWITMGVITAANRLEFRMEENQQAQ
jgi:hypothetical protein